MFTIDVHCMTELKIFHHPNFLRAWWGRIGSYFVNISVPLELSTAVFACAGISSGDVGGRYNGTL